MSKLKIWVVEEKEGETMTVHYHPSVVRDPHHFVVRVEDNKDISVVTCSVCRNAGCTGKAIKSRTLRSKIMFYTNAWATARIREQQAEIRAIMRETAEEDAWHRRTSKRW